MLPTVAVYPFQNRSYCPSITLAKRLPQAVTVSRCGSFVANFSFPFFLLFSVFTERRSVSHLTGASAGFEGSVLERGKQLRKPELVYDFFVSLLSMEMYFRSHKKQCMSISMNEFLSHTCKFHYFHDLWVISVFFYKKICIFFRNM